MAADLAEKRSTWIPVLALTALATVLRLFAIGGKTLWLDEAFSLWMARHALPDLWQWLVRIDQHPPLYYTLLHFWLALGDSEGTLRLFSALCGILTIPLMYSLGETIGGGPSGLTDATETVAVPGVVPGDGRPLGLLAALLLAVSPLHVEFGQEARMYALLTLATTLAMWAVARLLRWPEMAAQPIGAGLWAWIIRQVSTLETAPRHTQTSAPSGLRLLVSGFRTFPERTPAKAHPMTDLTWLAYIIGTAAAMLSHNTAIFFPLAINVVVLVYLLSQTERLPKSWWRVSLLPRLAKTSEVLRPEILRRYVLAVWLRRGRDGNFLRNWLLAQLAVLLLWSVWLSSFITQSLLVYREFWIPRPSLTSIAVTMQMLYASHIGATLLLRPWLDIIVLALVGIGLRSWRQERTWLAFTLGLWLIAPLGELIVSIWRPIFYIRTLIWTSIPLYLILAAAVLCFRSTAIAIKGWRIPYGVPLAALLVISLGGVGGYYFGYEKERWDLGAAYVAEHAQPDDLILFNATWIQIPFDYYFQRYDLFLAERGAPVDLFDRGLEPKMTAADLPRLRDLLRGRRRVWLVYSHNWYTDPQGLIPRELEGMGRLVEKREMNGLQVRLYAVDVGRGQWTVDSAVGRRRP